MNDRAKDIRDPGIFGRLYWHYFLEINWVEKNVYSSFLTEYRSIRAC